MIYVLGLVLSAVFGLIVAAMCAASGRSELEAENRRLVYENKKLMKDLGEPYETDEQGRRKAGGSKSNNEFWHEASKRDA